MDSKDYVLIPENATRPGVWYAVNPDGIEVPLTSTSNLDNETVNKRHIYYRTYITSEER
jgi:hypothetical protein